VCLGRRTSSRYTGSHALFLRTSKFFLPDVVPDVVPRYGIGPGLGPTRPGPNPDWARAWASLIPVRAGLGLESKAQMSPESPHKLG
jgi:hypothetical protein